jgi:ATP-dependent DNA ligase
VKHDGYRMLARRDGEHTRLISRHGRDWGDSFAMIVAAVEALAVRQISLSIQGQRQI